MHALCDRVRFQFWAYDHKAETIRVTALMSESLEKTSRFKTQAIAGQQQWAHNVSHLRVSVPV